MVLFSPYIAIWNFLIILRNTSILCWRIDSSILELKHIIFPILLHTNKIVISYIDRLLFFHLRYGLQCQFAESFNTLFYM